MLWLRWNQKEGKYQTVNIVLFNKKIRQPVAIHPPLSSRLAFVQAAQPDCCQRTGAEHVTAPFWAAFWVSWPRVQVKASGELTLVLAWQRERTDPGQLQSKVRLATSLTKAVEQHSCPLCTNLPTDLSTPFQKFCMHSKGKSVPLPHTNSSAPYF